MAYINQISILIQAKDQASAVLKTTAASVKATASSLDKTGIAMSNAGSAVTKGFTIPVVAAALAGAKMAYDFQNKMELLHTNAGIAQSAIAGLSTEVLRMAGQVGQAPDKLAEGLYHIASAGNGIWKTSQMMDILKVAAEGANLGLANLDDTTYALTSAMASNVKGAKNASEMMAVLNAIVGAGDMHMQDLNGAIGTGFLATAATFGISIQSVGAALATLTDNGEHADAAATRLRMTWALMASPSAMATKQLTALGLTAENAKVSTAGMNAVFAKSGLSTTKLADDLRKPNGITAAMRDLQVHLEKAGLSTSETDAMLSKAFGGGRTDAALLTMLQNLDRMDSKFSAINHDTGTFQQKIKDLNNTNPQKMRDAWAGIQADLVILGGATLPVLASGFSKLSTLLSNIFGYFQGLSSPVKTVLGDLAVGMAASGPILWGLGKMTSIISGIPGKLDAAGSAWNTFEVKATIAWLKIKDGASAANDKFGKISDTIGGVVHTISSKAKDTAQVWGGTIADMLSKTKSGAIDMVKRAGDTSKGWATAAKNMATSSISTAASMGVQAAKSAGAWLKAAHDSDIGLGGTLLQLAGRGIQTAASFVKSAAMTSAAWVASAVKSGYAWITEELPRMTKAFLTTAASASINALKASAAWVRQAAVSSYAWVTQELPKIVRGFIITSGVSVKESIIAGAAQVKSAAVSSAAWLVSMAKISTSYVATKVIALYNLAVQGAAWLVATGKAAAYGIAIDLDKTSMYALGAAGLSTSKILAAAPWAAAIALATADVLLLIADLEKVNQLLGQASKIHATAATQKQQILSDEADASNLLKQGKISQSQYNDSMANFKKQYSTIDSGSSWLKSLGLAGGTNFAPGGTTLVGENGPELVNLPTGSQVLNNAETKHAFGGGKNVIIEQLNINSNIDARLVVRQIGWQLAMA